MEPVYVNAAVEKRHPAVMLGLETKNWGLGLVIVVSCLDRGFRDLLESVSKLIIKKNPVNTFCVKI